MQNMSFYLQHWENIGTQMISQDHWSFHLYLHQCHLLHNFHSLQKVIHQQNRKTMQPVLRKPSWPQKNNKSTTKPVTKHLNLPNHSKKHMAVCSLSLHQGGMESCKTLEQKFSFQIGTLNLHSIDERFSINYFKVVGFKDIYSLYIFFYFMLYRAPVNTTPVTEGVTLFKY